MQKEPVKGIEVNILLTPSEFDILTDLVYDTQMKTLKEMRNQPGRAKVEELLVKYFDLGSIYSKLIQQIIYEEV